MNAANRIQRFICVSNLRSRSRNKQWEGMIYMVRLRCAVRESWSTFTGQGRGRRSRTLRNVVRLFITRAGGRAAPRLWRNNHAHDRHDHRRTMTPICFLTYHQNAQGYSFHRREKFDAQICSCSCPYLLQSESCMSVEVILMIIIGEYFSMRGIVITIIWYCERWLVKMEYDFV